MVSRVWAGRERHLLRVLQILLNTTELVISLALMSVEFLKKNRMQAWLEEEGDVMNWEVSHA